MFKSECKIIPKRTTSKWFKDVADEAPRLDIPMCIAILEQAFMDCRTLIEVNMPEVAMIGKCAFSGCINLKHIYLPKCTTIDDYAFVECLNLMSAYLPNCVSIGRAAFRDCRMLKIMSLPMCEMLECDVFNDCTSLERVELDIIQSFSGNIFKHCQNLSSVYAPKCDDIQDGYTYLPYDLTLSDKAQTIQLSLTLANGQTKTATVLSNKQLDKLVNSQPFKLVKVLNKSEHIIWMGPLQYTIDELITCGKQLHVSSRANVRYMTGSATVSDIYLSPSIERFTSLLKRVEIVINKRSKLKEIILPSCTYFRLMGDLNTGITIDAPKVETFVADSYNHIIPEFYFPNLTVLKISQYQYSYVPIVYTHSNPYLYQMLRHGVVYSPKYDQIKKHIERAKLRIPSSSKPVYQIIYPEHIQQSPYKHITDYLYEYSEFYQTARRDHSPQELEELNPREFLTKGELIDKLSFDNEYELAIQVAKHVVERTDNPVIEDLFKSACRLGVSRFMHLVRAMLPDDVYMY